VSAAIAAPNPQPVVPTLVSDAPVTLPAITVEAAAAESTSPTITAVVDGTVGGTVFGPDGATLVVPPGAYPGTFVLSLGEDATHGNLGVGGRILNLRATDAAGSSIWAFDQPLSLTVALSPADLEAAGGDPGAVLVSILDPNTGASSPLEVALNEDGTLSATVSGLAPAPLAQDPPLDLTAESLAAQSLTDDSLPAEDLSAESLPADEAADMEAAG
jgi:hypothetical protein